MAASYPGAVKNFLVLEDGVDTVIAAHPNDRAAEITAIETELGTDPAGSAADLKTRLAVALNNDGTIKTGAVAIWKHSGSQVFSGASPTSFTDLNLSAIVGANYAFVVLKVTNSTGGYLFTARTNGETAIVGNSTWGGGTSLAALVDNTIAYIALETDSAGIIEIKGDVNNNITINLIGYFAVNN